MHHGGKIMSLLSPDADQSAMKILPLIFVLIIVACAVMIGYLLLYIPYECQNLVVRSGGTASCGLNAGAYIIAALDAIIAVAAAVMLIHGLRKDQG
jgi:hypothetical protein